MVKLLTINTYFRLLNESMKAASTQQIKEELKGLSGKEIIELCLRLVRYKKENKELLSYILFDSHDRQGYTDTIKTEMDEDFASLPRNSRYLIKKGLRSMLKTITKYSRYMGEKDAEAELRLHFCRNMKNAGMASHVHQATTKIYTSQLDKIQTLIPELHEDLQFDFQKQLNNMNN
jgi:hypothetical protein